MRPQSVTIDLLYKCSYIPSGTEKKKKKKTGVKTHIGGVHNAMLHLCTL